MDWLAGIAHGLQFADRLVNELLWVHGRRAVRLRWIINGVRCERSEVMLLLRDDQKVSLAIEPVDAKGNPAKIDGVPVWTNSDEMAGVLTVADDGFSAVFVAGQPGVTQIAVKADADLGAGIREITSTLDVSVEPGEAVGLSIKAGVPEPQ